MTRILAIVIAALSVLLVIQTFRAASLETRRQSAVDAAVAWEFHAKGWMASFEEAELRRGREVQAAQDAATSLIQQCADRVAEARQSARVIERIVTQEPTYDENRCPVRRLVDPDELRRALQPAG